MENFKGWFDQKELWIYLLKVVEIVILYIIFRLVSNLILKEVFSTVKHSKNKTVQVNPAVSFLFSSTKVILNILFVLLALPFFGIKTSSIAAFLGALGLGVGLGLQDIAVDLFSGMKLLLTKPFSIGDKISSNGMTGTVQEMNIIHTIMLGDESNITIYMPNRLLTGNAIMNFSQQEIQLIEVRFPILIQIPFPVIREALSLFVVKYLTPIKEDSLKIQMEALQPGYIKVICSFWCSSTWSTKSVTGEVLEFVQQTILEYQSKNTHK